MQTTVIWIILCKQLNSEVCFMLLWWLMAASALLLLQDLPNNEMPNDFVFNRRFGSGLAPLSKLFIDDKKIQASISYMVNIMCASFQLNDFLSLFRSSILDDHFIFIRRFEDGIY